MSALEPDHTTPQIVDRHSEFMRLFATHCDQIRRYIAILLPQAADADEVFQQASITLWRTFGQFEADRDFLAWAYGIALNHVRNHRRVESRQPVYLFPEEVLEIIGNSYRATHHHLDDRRTALGSCLEQLSPADRNLVIRCYGGIDRPKDAAAELGRSVHSIYKRLRTIRRRLFDCINQTLAGEVG